MLNKISIQNFKKINARQDIKLKPLTIICGRNSSGKSTILQSILLLKQSIKFLLQSKLSARQATRYYARSYTARKRAGRKNGKSKEQKVAPRGEVLNPME